MQALIKLLRNRLWLTELFVFSNLAFLALDIFIAHSVNDFAHWGEWIPFYFSLLATPLMIPMALCPGRSTMEGWSYWIGNAIGWTSVAIGVLGLVFHLESSFFSNLTLVGLVYTAPFAAPLSYSGLGLLLVLNRIVSKDSAEWGVWVVFLSLGGFVGNFLLAVFDHGQNGFFHVNEWIPVFSSALAIGFLFQAMLVPGQKKFLDVCMLIIAAQIFVGLLGFYLHFVADLSGVSVVARDNFLYGAPVFAPLLFANLAMLAFLGLFELRSRIES